jgi:hypothetical protein
MLLSILYGQFAYSAFSPYQPVSMYDSNGGFDSANDSLFEIKPAVIPPAQKYEFEWEALKTQNSPFEDFLFI